LPGDEFEVPADVIQTMRVELPHALATATAAVDQTRFLHHPQVFGYGLPCDAEAAGEPGY
jgi:hypothetical protein